MSLTNHVLSKYRIAFAKGNWMIIWSLYDAVFQIGWKTISLFSQIRSIKWHYLALIFSEHLIKLKLMWGDYWSVTYTLVLVILIFGMCCYLMLWVNIKINTSTNKTSVESLFLPMKRRTLGTGQQRTFDSCRLWLHPLYLSIHLTKGHKGNGQFQRIKLSSTKSHWYIACFNRVLEVYMLLC